MKSMSDEIVSLETIETVENSLRAAINDQATMMISRLAAVRRLALGLGIINIVLTIGFILFFVTR